MSTTTKICTVCKKEFEWTQTGGRPAKRCEDCRPASRANSNGTRHKARVEIGREPDEAAEGMSALDVIDSFSRSITTSATQFASCWSDRMVMSSRTWQRNGAAVSTERSVF